jgi:hypothetical protein
MSIKSYQGKQNSHSDFPTSNDFSSGKMSDNQLYQIKQSAYFHHEVVLINVEILLEKAGPSTHEVCRMGRSYIVVSKNILSLDLRNNKMTTDLNI